MINLVLQELGQILFFAGAKFMPSAAQILVTHGDFAVTLNLHENRKKAEAGIPDDDFFFASLRDFGIHERPRLGIGQLQENDPQGFSELRRGDGSAIASGLSPVRQSVGQILDERANFGAGWIRDGPADFAQPRIPQLQHAAYGHSAQPSTTTLILNPSVREIRLLKFRGLRGWLASEDSTQFRLNQRCTQ